MGNPKGFPHVLFPHLYPVRPVHWRARPGLCRRTGPGALNSLSSIPSGAASAKVLDQNGHALGQVTAIQTDQYGKPSAVAFRATNGNTVVIGAAAVSFDGSVLVADNEQPQIAALSAARVASN